jgi:aminoglycoside phosphotransferase (APT) family kinase protein
MHADGFDLDARLVRRLVATQFPHLRGLQVRRVRSTGTVNAIFRLGDDLCARLPRARRWAASLETELEWLPRLVTGLPLAVPEPIATGRPGNGYPLPWAVYRWIEGETYAPERIVDERRAAADLADFVAQLRRIDPAGAPPAGRRPLLQLDAATRAAIESAREAVDTDAATAAWASSLEAPPWNGVPTWIHCDLIPPNLLVERGGLKAIIDFGAAGIGDPAQDVVPAWSVFGREGRQVFRGALRVDEPTWVRARGFALHQALLIIPYYRETNPAFVDMAMRTVEGVLDDWSQ